MLLPSIKLPLAYNKENHIAFYKRVQNWKDVNQSIIFTGDEPKLSRKISGAPFSIICLKYGEMNEPRYYALSDMQVATPGGFGRIKAGFPLQVDSSSGSISIDFTKPTAIKIMHWRKISLHPPVRQTASNYMEKQYSPIFGTLTRHERKDMDKYYYAMPLYSGMCFSDYLSKYANSTSTKSWIAIMLKIALAIQSLHKEGCVHLDIKPNNMIINSQKDFLNLNLIDLDFMTKTGAPTSKVGTKNYMCPELSALKRSEKIPATVAMDLYSLGILLQKIYKILIKKESVSLIKVPLSELIISMVKLKPAERIISINNVLLKLRNIQSILSLQLLPDNPEAKSWACKKPLNKISIPIRTKRSRNPLQNIECPHYNSPVKSPPKRRHVSSSSHSESPTLSVAEFFCPQAASM